MERLYRFFNPSIVELIAKQKFGSMNKFLLATERQPSWWHRSKKASTIKLSDVESMAVDLGVHPSDFLEDSERFTQTNMAEETAILYAANNAAITQRLNQLVQMKADNNQARFSELTGISKAQVSNLIAKKHSPGFHTLSRIIRTFSDINARWLLTGEGSPIASETDNQDLRELLASKEEIISLLKSQVAALQQRE